MSKIFISHSASNNAPALAVSEWLKENGWDDLFLDINPTRGLTPGERWQEALKIAADRCEAVLFLISPSWRDSRWCLAEFLLAKQLGKTIFGILIEATPLDTLPKEITAEWQLCDLVAGRERQVFHVQSDPIVAATEVSFASSGLQKLRQGLQKAGLDPATFPWPPKHEPDRVPYRGLKALDIEDAAILFGREASIVRGLDALRGLRERGGEHMFVILGASGAGKSSFLRAGLWPRLARDDRHFLPLPVIRPERAVITGPTGLITSLETALPQRRRTYVRADIRKALETATGFSSLLHELQVSAISALDKDQMPPTLVIPIDQAEELFSADGHEEATAFLTLLSHLLSPPVTQAAQHRSVRNQVIFLMAIRSESYGHLQSEPQLAYVKKVPFDLSPLTITEYKAVIEGPAARATLAGRKLTIDPELKDALLRDTVGADALPLLAFTLERLFVEYGGDGDLRLSEYEGLGGISGVINGAIESAFTNPRGEPAIPVAKAEQERLLRSAFIPWLARIDPDTEERKRRVARWEEIPLEACPLIERMISQRLLLRDLRKVEDEDKESVVIEVAHEALLRQWNALQTWLDQDSDQLKQLEAVQRAAGEWSKNNCNDTWLVHSGARLISALTLLQRPDFVRRLGEEGNTYLKACHLGEEHARAEREAQRQRELDAARQLAEETEKRRQSEVQRAEEAEKRADEQSATARRLHRRAWLLFGALVVSTALGVKTWELLTESRLQTREAFAKQLAFQSDVLRNQSPALFERSKLIAIEAIRLFPSIEADQSLRADFALLQHSSMRFAHEGSLTSVAFSPDGKLLATASVEGTARLWDVVSGKELARLAHNVSVNKVAFSPDGKLLATASEDWTAGLWDVASGKELLSLTHDGLVDDIAFSPDGKLLATAGKESTARLWDVVSGKELARLAHDGSVKRVTFSPNGKLLATAAVSSLNIKDSTARLWDVSSSKELDRLVHGASVNGVAFSPDSKMLATASEDWTAGLWNVASGKKQSQLAHGESVNDVAFSPDGKLLATASNDRTARLWDVSSGKELARLVHDEKVNHVAFSPDGKLLATATGSLIDIGERTARLWDVGSGKELARLAHDVSVIDVAFSPDGKLLVTATGSLLDNKDSTARLWKVGSGKEQTRLAHEWGVNDVAFSPDGQLLATISGNKTTRVWEVANGKELTSITHDDRVDHVTFSPDGKMLATANGGTFGKKDGAAQLWLAASGKELAHFAHDEYVRYVAFSPDGKLFATATGGFSFDKKEGTARLWEVASGNELARLAHEDIVYHVLFSPDGKLLATDSTDKTARLWDVGSGKELARLAHDGIVYHIAFSPDGQLLATACQDKTARLWDVASGKELARLAHDDSVYHVAFSPDGQLLATTTLGLFSGSKNQIVRLWDVASGKELARITHDATVNDVTFSPDGKILATASDDRTARLWDVGSGKELARITHNAKVNHVAFSSDGQLLVTASEDATARLSRWRPEDMIIATCTLLNRNLSYAEWRQYFGNEPYHKTCADLPIGADLLDEGKRLALAGKIPEAIAALRELQVLEPNLNPEKEAHKFAAMGWFDRGKRDAEKGNVEVASVAFRAAKNLDSTLTLDPDSEASKLAALGLIDKGRQLAKEGKVHEASATFRAAKNLDPSHTLDPETEADKLAVMGLIEKGRQLAIEGKMQEASAVFREAKHQDPNCILDPDREAGRLAAPGLIEKGKQLAKAGKIEEAIAAFRAAKSLDPSRALDPDKEAGKLAAPGVVKKGQEFARAGQIQEAIAAYAHAQQLDPKSMSADAWNSLCWNGSVMGHAAEVKKACQQAVSLSSQTEYGFYRDSRGVARALTGNTRGAIEDFQAFVAWAMKEKIDVALRKRREDWIIALKAGKNPFDEATLKKLREE
ncbi:MAG: TIR domain-containing protein [Methylococcales bacterium]|nr:TIR domain-containing protein [Methylococcales bacterium]